MVVDSVVVALVTEAVAKAGVVAVVVVDLAQQLDIR